MTEPKNHLHEGFWKIPEKATQMMTAKELRETLLHTGGEFMRKFIIWTIKHKHLGAGAYKVWAEKRVKETPDA